MMTIFDSSVDRLKHLYALKFDFKIPGFKRTLAKLIACKCDATLRFKVLKAKMTGAVNSRKDDTC